MRIATGAVRPRNDITFARGTVWNRRADRGVRPYGWGIDGAVCGGTHGSRPTLHYFVGQGPCALPRVRYKVGGAMWGANRALPVAEEAR